MTSRSPKSAPSPTRRKAGRKPRGGGSDGGHDGGNGGGNGGAAKRKDTAANALEEVALLPSRTPSTMLFAGGRGEPDMRLNMRASGVPASELDVPIAPSAALRDDRLFADPAQAGKSFWLPRYALDEEIVGSERRYRVRLTREGDDWRLEIVLRRFPAPAIEAKASPDNVIDHTLAVELSFAVGGGGRRALAFDEVGEPGETVLARLTLDSLVARDQVLEALREPARASLLTVRRSVRVAVPEQRRRENRLLRPLPGVVAPIDRLRPVPDRVIIDRLRPQKLPKPRLRYAGSKTQTIRGTAFTRHYLEVTNWKSYQPALFKAAPNLPPCGNNRNASRTWVKVVDGRSGRQLAHYCAFGKPGTLARIPFGVKQGTRPPATVRVRLTDRRKKKTVTSDAIPLRAARPQPQVPTYRVVDAALDHVLAQQPFSFAPDLHPYVYDADGLADPGKGPPGGLRRERHTYRGRTHSYFQDVRHRRLIYRLPDEMRLERHRGDYRPPLMTLTVSQPGSSTESAQAALDYVIAPYTDPERLEEARPVLADRFGLAAEEIEFQQLLPGSVTYTIRRPSGPGLVNEQRPATPRLVEEPLADRLTMPLADFQLAFDMMRGDSAGSIGGMVVAGIEGEADETIPVVFDLGELTEQACDLALFVGAGQLLVRLSNRIESPLMLDRPRLALKAGERSAELALEDPEGKARMAPGEEREFTVALPEGFGTGPIEARIASGVRIEPDSEALLWAILDTTTLEYFRTVIVETVPGTFRVPEGDPGRQIVAILVAFESGSTVVLRENELQGTVRIDHPFAEIMLGREVPRTYRFTRRIVRANGEQDDLGPHEAQDDHIFISETS